ncbi:MAG: exosortase E/protease, VPEID-CTERM system [Polyangiales bacterium]
MSAETADDVCAPDARLTARWLLAAALLIAEYVLAVLVFDSERLPIAEETDLFRSLGESMPFFIVVMTAALLVGGVPPETERKEIAAALRTPRRVWPLFACHLAAYALALAITIFVFNRGVELERPWLSVALWAASAISSFCFLVAAMVPRAAIRPLGKPVARALASGLVVGVLALLAGSATSSLWLPMSRLTLGAVVSLLHLTGQDVVSIPEELIVGTPSYEVFIDRPCSGYEGIGLIAVMLGFYLFYFRKSLRFPNAILLLPLGIALIWIANAFRIAALIAVGTWISPEIAEGGFHSAAGWLLFCTITLALVAVSRHSGWFAIGDGLDKGSLRTPEGAFLLPLLFLIAAGLVSGLFATDFDYLYPLRVVAPLIPLWLFRSYYQDLRWSWSWTPFVLGVVVFVVWVALEPTPNAEAVAVIPNALSEMPVAFAAFWLIARVAGSVVVVPVAEELAFRGYLLRRLIDADFTAVSPKHFTAISFIISSVAFGALHGRWLAGIIAGMIYAAAQYRRGQISDAIVAHAVTNGLLAAYVLVFGHWAFW